MAIILSAWNIILHYRVGVYGLADAISLLKPATDLANDIPALANGVLGNEFQKE